MESKVIEIISRNSGYKLNELTKETKLNDLGLDSLDKANVMMEIEEELGVVIPSSLDANIQTVGEVVDLFLSYKK